MSDEVRSISEAAARMDAFGDANAGVIAPLTIAAAMFAELKTIRQNLEQSGAARSSFGSAGKSETQSKVAVYNSIYRRLRRMARTAVMIKKHDPSFDNKYLLPRDKMPYQEGIERAKAFFTDSGTDKQKFIDFGIKNSFFGDLSADITTFEGAGIGQIDAKMSSVGETANIDALVERFMEIHAPLNQIMKNLFADDPQLLAEWRTAAHIERKKSKPAPPTT